MRLRRDPLVILRISLHQQGPRPGAAHQLAIASPVPATQFDGRRVQTTQAAPQGHSRLHGPSGDPRVLIAPTGGHNLAAAASTARWLESSSPLPEVTTARYRPAAGRARRVLIAPTGDHNRRRVARSGPISRSSSPLSGVTTRRRRRCRWRGPRRPHRPYRSHDLRLHQRTWDGPARERYGSPAPAMLRAPGALPASSGRRSPLGGDEAVPLSMSSRSRASLDPVRHCLPAAPERFAIESNPFQRHAEGSPVVASLVLSDLAFHDGLVLLSAPARVPQVAERVDELTVPEGTDSAVDLGR